MNCLGLLTALLRKDLLVELRSKETTGLLLALSLLLGVVTAFGLNAAFLEAAAIHKLYPVMLWIVFLFAATVSTGRSYDFEIEHMAIEGLRLAGAAPGAIYAAKFAANSLVIFAGHIFSAVVLSLLLDTAIIQAAPGLLVISMMVVLAYSALSTLLAAMASTSKLRNMLLPLILLPLLFPVLFAALETTSELLARGSVAYDSFWVSLLLVLDVLYIVLGTGLYGAVISE